MTVVLVTPPANEPVTLAEVKSQARIYSTLDDSFITGVIIPAARASIETETRRAFVSQTWTLKLDNFPLIDPAYEQGGYSPIILPKPPFQSITSFTYIDVAGVTQTLTATGPNGETAGGAFYGYQLDPGSETQPARLLPPWAKPWPPTRRIPMAVQVRFVAGYGDLDTETPPQWVPRAIPVELKQAILLQAAHFYENREAISADGKTELARGVRSLISPYINEIA
jgi:uncharacterized phiE125 gp8 family phage protein